MTTHPQRDNALLLLRLSALIGLVIAGYLLYLAVTGQTAPGCGEGAGGCNQILASRWSKVMGLPVSALAIMAYLLILAASIHAGPRNPQRHRDGAWRILAVVGCAAGLSALWFIALQLLVLHGLCLYCMSAHACSLIVAGIALVRARSFFSIAGAVPIGVLIALQLFVPPSPPGFEQKAEVFGNFDPHATPTLGDPDAPDIIAFLFDYNCAYCREAHRTVVDAVERYDGRLAVVMLPTALDPACNPGATTPGPHSQTSCQLARLALAVWLADPSKFAEYDDRLIEHAQTYPDPHATPDQYVLQARLIAERLVPRAELDQALADPRIDERLKTAGWVYENATYQGRHGVPRLIITGRPLPGLADRDQLFDILERAYPDLSPPTK